MEPQGIELSTLVVDKTYIENNVHRNQFCGQCLSFLWNRFLNRFKLTGNILYNDRSKAVLLI